MGMDRADLFRNLSTDDFHNYDPKKQEVLLGEYYEDFENLCNFLKKETSPDGNFYENVSAASCRIEPDGVYFEVTLTGGDVKKIHIDHPIDRNSIPDENSTVELSFPDDGNAQSEDT